MILSPASERKEGIENNANNIITVKIAISEKPKPEKFNLYPLKNN
jgi:hypothetical protein